MSRSSRKGRQAKATTPPLKPARTEEQSAPAQRKPLRVTPLLGGLALVLALLVVVAGWFLKGRAPAVPEVSAASPAEHAVLNAGFLGSQACQSCHAPQYAAWDKSQHRHAMQHLSAETALGDFNDARFSYAGVESRFFRRDGKYFVRTDGPDGKLADFELKYTFGVEPLQQYLVEFPDGRLQALGVAWDTRPKEKGGQRWFHLYPQERVDFKDELHWTKRSQNWNFMCADCHSTNLQKGYDAQADTFKTTWSEISVGCEACHGPGANHVELAKKQDANPAAGLTVKLDERHGVLWQPDAATGNSKRSVPRTSQREMDVCAQCHARRAQVAEGYQAGKPFMDHYQPALLTQGLYHADGQQQDEVFIWGSFLQSKMNHAGVTCSDCHEPHSGKLRAEGNAVCAQCHMPTRYDTPAHTFHKAGAQCADCHMPAKDYMVVDPRRDHSLRIPRPDLSVSMGTPNACNSCHTDKPPKWADDAVRKWYKHAPQGFQKFAATLQAGRQGALTARHDLTTLANEATAPAIAKATALRALQGFPSPQALVSIRSGLLSSDPLMRMASIQGLAPMPPAQRVPLIAPLLDDPLRVVRMEAASSLAEAPASAFDAAQSASFARAATEYEQTQRYLADRPEGRVALGSFYLRQARVGDAEAELKSAAAMRPLYVPALVNLSDLYRGQGNDAMAEQVLREGLAIMPDDASMLHAQGLALTRLRRNDEALQALKRATQIEPANSRYAYVYAVALHSFGSQRAAFTEIDRALVLRPADTDLLSAGMSFAQQGGDNKTMERYAARLSALRSNTP
ncbi:multiheme c-type cytochrome [Uliginosibacterium sp. H3]|uniref:Multiheme c-type cytochrome n=1 Tax=Uliginosibacterium silvisoli TaxID=3114758 RepID=A0ABU6K619_9RHOO|nr:multiheme c-type cytochrome [Uliginosibacterium sp. H3]